MLPDTKDSFSISYESPLAKRYSSKEMAYFFSNSYKYTTWRRLWLALASAEKELGLPITNQQIAEMQASLDVFDLEKIAFYEHQLRHEVMAHIYAFGDLCPSAKSILHWGTTSSFVIDNTELLQMKQGVDLIESKLVMVIEALAIKAEETAALSCLSYTHLQAAQPTTYGKRICLWLQDFFWDLKQLRQIKPLICFLGVKGATGSQDALLSLFNGDHEKVEQLEILVAKNMHLERIYRIASQTYPRKLDQVIVSCFASLASSSHKMATDIRLLCHMEEIDEPFESSQVGSSAMPYKRNPILSERICSLSRHVLSLWNNPAYTSSLQWLERSLDDSANKRMTIPEVFLTIDGILTLLYHLIQGMVLYPKKIEKRLQHELPYLALERILVESVKKGQNRQEVHERLRQHAFVAKNEEKKNGITIDLRELLIQDPLIGLSLEEIDQILQAESFTGRCKEQVKNFLEKDLRPYLGSMNVDKVSIHGLSI